MPNNLKKSVLATMLVMSPVVMANQAQAQMAAMLPTADSVEPAAATDADGTYMVSTINKRITIDRGRAYVVDPWTHALIFRVKRGMVTLQNFRQTGPDQFEADDLPMMGKVVFTRQPNGTLQGVVQGAFGEAKYALVPANYSDGPAPAPGPGDDVPVGAPPPLEPVQRDQVYRLHVSAGECQGSSLVRKRFRGQVLISMTDPDGENMVSKWRNFDVFCTKKGKRTQSYKYYSNGPGALEITLPEGSGGFSGLQIRGTYRNLATPRSPFIKGSNLLDNAFGASLNVNGRLTDDIQVAGNKANLNFTITMERVQ
ncbi:MAG: hypothetical protein ABJ239_08120 [Erythrobacter sp.]